MSDVEDPMDSVEEIVETGSITRRKVTRKSFIIQEVSKYIYFFNFHFKFINLH